MFRRHLTFAAVLCALLCLCGGASAETRLYTFPTEQIPAALLTAPEAKGDVTVRMTFAGDACLGVEERFFDYEKTFITQIRQKGFDYPFAKIKPLFDQDDITLINLETVLSDNDKLPKLEKRYVFRGPADFAKVLTEGGVECVSIENNHMLDEGEKGRLDTIAALRAENVSFCDAQYVTVLEKDGVRVGFFGFQFTLYRKKEIVQGQIDALKRAGCSMIVLVAHMGTDYGFWMNDAQKELMTFLEGKGVALVVGHHPHVAQGVVRKEDMQFVLSLGNFCFGSNPHPRDYDAVVATVDAVFQGGALQTQQLTLWPITISQNTNGNDYQPDFVGEKLSRRILAKMQKSSNYELSPYVEGQGCVQPVLVMPQPTAAPEEETTQEE